MLIIMKKERDKARSEILLLFKSLLLKQRVDFIGGVKKSADGHIVVERVDDVGKILRHINLAVPLAPEKFGRSVNKVCCEHLCNDAVFEAFVKFLKTFAEKTEG